MNFLQVSKPQVGPVAAAGDALRLVVADSDPPAAELRFTGSGHIQGLSARLIWNSAAVQPEAVEPGEMLGRAGAVALSPRPGAVDVVALGPGRGLRGEGALATFRFRRVGPGHPGIAVAAVTARDIRNRNVDLSAALPADATVPTGLRSVSPNPCRGSASVEFGLAAAAPAEVSVYDVGGRKVASLWGAETPAGPHRVIWSGAGSDGRALPAGIYFVKFRSGGVSQTRPVVVIR